MSNIRNLAPPVLPVPADTYSAAIQNILNAAIQQFGARTANAVNQILQSYTPQTIAYSNQITFVGGPDLTYRINLTGDTTVNPSATATDGDTVTLWVTAGGLNRTVTLNSSIVVPTTITGATPLTIAAGKKAVYTMRYDGTLNNGQWELTNFQNGY